MSIQNKILEEYIIKKNVSVLLICMISVCMLAACGETAESPNVLPAEAPKVSQVHAADEDAPDSNAMDQLRQIKNLEGKNINLVAVYNEVATLAVENGWEADEETVNFLGEAIEADAVLKPLMG